MLSQSEELKTKLQEAMEAAIQIEKICLRNLEREEEVGKVNLYAQNKTE